MTDRLAEIKAQRATLADGHTCLDLDWLPSIDWLIDQVENTDNRIENYLAKLDNQRDANARMQRQVESLQAEIRRRPRERRPGPGPVLVPADGDEPDRAAEYERARRAAVAAERQQPDPEGQP